MNDTTIAFGPIRLTLKAFLKPKLYSSVFILVDENTKKECLPLLHKFEHKTIEIPSGEKYKNLESCQSIWTQLLENQADRKALIINLGGGVICDMGGFAASCFKRGIDFIHIPTTLLAMVDAAIGGKTGINIAMEKNMIGLFSPAKGIFVDTQFLNTLNQRQINSGKAEMIKHGLIASDMHLENIFDSKVLGNEIIQESIGIKQYIVQQDPQEQGMRKSLNFGHTLGHAIETLALKNGEDLLHGEAVAYGMILALKLSVKYAGLHPTIAKENIQRIVTIFGSYKVNAALLSQLIQIAKNDKKNDGEHINFTLLSSIGKIEINQALKSEDLNVLLK